MNKNFWFATNKQFSSGMFIKLASGKNLKQKYTILMAFVVWLRYNYRKPFLI